MLNPAQFGGEFQHDPLVYPKAEQNPSLLRYGGGRPPHFVPNTERINAAMSPGGSRPFDPSEYQALDRPPNFRHPN